MTKKITATIGEWDNLTDSWEEKFEIDDYDDENTYVTAMIDKFNKTLNDGETKRVLVEVVVDEVTEVVVDEVTEDFYIEMTENAVCPYCGDEDYDSWEYGDTETIGDCYECDKEFTMEIVTTRVFTTRKIE